MTADAAGGDFDRRALVRHLAEDVVLPAYRAFDVSAHALIPAIDAHCAALGSADETARRDDARAAWRAAMDAWQDLELMLFGPAQGVLADTIYSWHSLGANFCAVDQD